MFSIIFVPSATLIILGPHLEDYLIFRKKQPMGPISKLHCFQVSSHHFAPASRHPPQHYLENSAQERERRTAAYSWLTTREARDSSRQGRPPARGPTAVGTSMASDQPHDRHQQVRRIEARVNPKVV